MKITSFDPQVSVMGSLRKPKRLTIHGSDEREYSFLVKAGEDLRQDQRSTNSLAFFSRTTFLS